MPTCSHQSSSCGCSSQQSPCEEKYVAVNCCVLCVCDAGLWMCEMSHDVVMCNRFRELLLVECNCCMSDLAVLCDEYVLLYVQPFPGVAARWMSELLHIWFDCSCYGVCMKIVMFWLRPTPGVAPRWVTTASNNLYWCAAYPGVISRWMRRPDLIVLYIVLWCQPILCYRMCQHSVTLNLIYLCVYFFVGMCKLLYRLVRFRGSHTCAGEVIEHQQQQEEEQSHKDSTKGRSKAKQKSRRCCKG